MWMIITFRKIITARQRLALRVSYTDFELVSTVAADALLHHDAKPSGTVMATHYKMADILMAIFSNAFSWRETSVFWFKIHRSFFSRGPRQNWACGQFMTCSETHDKWSNANHYVWHYMSLPGHNVATKCWDGIIFLSNIGIATYYHAVVHHESHCNCWCVYWINS